MCIHIHTATKPRPRDLYHLAQILRLPDVIMLRELDVRHQAAAVGERDVVLAVPHLEGEGPHLLHHGGAPCWLVFGVLGFVGRLWFHIMSVDRPQPPPIIHVTEKDSGDRRTYRGGTGRGW